MPGAYALSGGLNARTYADGYGLLQSFTTSGTAQGLQSTPITPAALYALNGVMEVAGGDGFRLMFAATTGATSVTAWVTGFEPLVAPDGSVAAYVERPLSSTAAVTLTLGIQVTTVTLTAAGATPTFAAAWNGAAPASTTVATTAVLISSVGSLTGAQPGVMAFNGGTTSTPAVVDFGGLGSGTGLSPNCGMFGVTHIRCLLSCATASQTVWCLAKRIKGNSILA